jgi:hypothetical protein
MTIAAGVPAMEYHDKQQIQSSKPKTITTPCFMFELSPRLTVPGLQFGALAILVEHA